jgi:hypothetical protein
MEPPLLLVPLYTYEKSNNQLTFIQYNVKPKHPVMGSALHIPLPKSLKTGSSISTKITYKTTDECTALQWLDKEYVINPILSRKMLTQGTVRLKGDNFHIFSVNANPSMLVQSLLCKVNFSFIRIFFHLIYHHFFTLLDTSSSKIVL